MAEESKGLGDTIAKITHALGIDKVAESVAHALGQEDCGCGRRQEALNELFPYRQKTPDPIPTPLLDSDYEFDETRSFEVVFPLVANNDGNQVTFQPGEVIEINKDHFLYSYLKYLLENHRIKLVE